RVLAHQSRPYRDLSLPDPTSGAERRAESGGASLKAAIRQTGRSAAAVASALPTGIPEIARRHGKLQSKLRGGSSGPATPQPAIAPRHEWQAVLIAGPIRVFRQLEILLGRLPAFAVLPHLLHLCGGLLHQREDVLRILLGAESTTRLTGMSGNQPLPVQREDLLDELLRFERIHGTHATPPTPPDCSPHDTH